MKRLILSGFVIIFLLAGYSVTAQEDFLSEQDTLPDNVLLERQWSLGAFVHTNGWGLQFRIGKNITARRQWMWEVQYSTYKSVKEIRVINPYFADAKSYIYGKLNYVSFLRGGTGEQFILTRKPYWGGVQVSALIFGGVSLGVTKPVYLYIIKTNPINSNVEIVEEKYNPAIHTIDNIYGRASFLSGITNLGFYPGVYVKTGLEFEIGNLNKKPKALETGAQLDFSPIGIPIMALNPPQRVFLTLYVSFSFGKRYNK
jgi:hypothetical protein